MDFLQLLHFFNEDDEGHECLRTRRRVSSSRYQIIYSAKTEFIGVLNLSHLRHLWRIDFGGVHGRLMALAL
jgi:hypothetical protein